MARDAPRRPDRARAALFPVAGRAVLARGGGEPAAPGDRLGSPRPRGDGMIQTFLFSGGALWTFVKLATLTFVVIAVLRLVPGPNRQVPGYRARPLRATMKYGSGWTAAAAVVVGCATVVSHVEAPPGIMPKAGTLDIGMYA